MEPELSLCPDGKNKYQKWLVILEIKEQTKNQ